MNNDDNGKRKRKRKRQIISNRDSEEENSNEDTTEEEDSDGDYSEEEDSDDEEDSVGYFERDASKLKATINKHILAKLSNSQKSALKNIIDTGINDAFKQVKDIIKHSFGYVIGRQPTNNLWKLGLGPEEIKMYSKRLKELRKDAEEHDRITIQRILDAPLSKFQKRYILRRFDALQTMDPYSDEHCELENELNEKLSSAVKSSISPENLQIMEKKEIELKHLIGIDMPLRARILNAEMDDAHKAAIYEKYLLLQKTPEDSVTYASLEEWIEEALKTPYSKMATDITQTCSPGECLVNLRIGFKSRLAEMDSVLEPLMVFFNKRLHNPNAKSTVIGLLGAAGCGKTSVGEVIAKVWKLPFKQISLGGVIDSSILDGQHSGWVGSNPGRFAKALQEMGVINGVLFLDEIDKLGSTIEGIQVQNSLLHSTDPSQNSAFNDHYLGSKLTLDLSKTLIICALNSIENISTTLLSRIHIIKIPDYTTEQKINILNKHLFPNALQDAGLTTDDVQLSADAYSTLLNNVENYVGKEGGVRGLKASIHIIVDKLALLLKTTPKQQRELQLSFNVNVSKKPVVITTDIVNKLYKLNEESNQTWKYMYN
jgi:ATP-dependent Lon protease